MDYPEPARSMVRRLGQETIASVPLMSRSKAVGVMNVAFARPRVVEAVELELLSAMGSHFAAAVVAHRLLEDQRRRIADLGLLQEVGRSLVATLEPRQVLDLGVRSLAQSVGVTDAYLLLADPSGASLVIRAEAGSHPELLGRALPTEPPGSSVAATAYHSRAPVLVNDAATDPRVNQALRTVTGGRSYLALPLIVRDKAIGAVVTLDPSGPRQHSSADIERATGIANQLAAAVENARLYDDLRDSYAALARAQAQSVRQERLAALGELSAVVAHEVRNPLGAIFNAVGSLKQLLQPTGDQALLLKIVREEADRLNSIVSDLLDFARPRAPTLHRESVGLVIDDAVAAALGTSHTQVRVVREFDPQLPLVPMDARLLRQAVLNVAMNALQAMPQGGELTVRTRAEAGPQGKVVRIEVSDSGTGISEHLRARIFEPFFTTRAAGTGLGLALVKRIIEDHRGEVEVTSAPGQGTTFILKLPLEAPAA
jgi:signal transduction histidine kinase